MGNMMKIGGKSDNNIATPIRVSESGNVVSNKEWRSELDFSDAIFKEVVTDTDVHATALCNLANKGIISLRVFNTTGVPVSLLLYADNGGKYLYNLDGQRVGIDVPSNNYCVIITPEDLPVLNYLCGLKIGVKAKSTPTAANGKVEIYLASKN